MEEAQPRIPTFLVMQTGESPSLLLRMPPATFRQGGRPGKCFLFNVPEGAARFCLEHHIKLTSSMESAFLTRCLQTKLEQQLLTCCCPPVPQPASNIVGRAGGSASPAVCGRTQ